MTRRRLAKFFIGLTFIAALLGGMEVHPSSQAPFLVFGSQSGVPVAIKATSNALWVSLVSVASPLLFADGTSGAPSMAFTSEPTLGFYRNASGNATFTGALTATSSLGTASGNAVLWSNGTNWMSAASGIIVARNNGNSVGSEFKVDVLPTVSACGAGSPAVTAGSTPFAGSVTIGTTNVATCTVSWGGTAYPSAPFCTANVVTATAGTTRAIGTTTTTGSLVLVPASNFVDSSVVAWMCVSSK